MAKHVMMVTKTTVTDVPVFAQLNLAGPDLRKPPNQLPYVKGHVPTHLDTTTDFMNDKMETQTLLMAVMVVKLNEDGNV